VSRRDTYTIRISGLSDGNHDFSFFLGEAFFASREQSEIMKGDVKAEVMLEKKAGVLSLCFKLKGQVEVVCDRCLEPFWAEVDLQQALFVKIGDTPGEIEDDVVMIHKNDHEIEVGQFMYEFIVLGLPLKRTHPEDIHGVPACDPVMIRKLDQHRGTETIKEKSDPRWDALKGIIGKTQ
jgi:uncharacterized metal-binding protein YceD (DUF177 family)